MNCNMTHVAADVYACANEGCGRIFKYTGKKSPPVRSCKGALESSQIPVDVRLRAEEIASHVVEIDQTMEGGPGTEFRKLAVEYDVEQKSCGCAATESRMNRLGPDGCRREIESLIDEVMANARKMAKPMTRGLARHAIEEAIRCAEAVENA